jgi:glycosyltransferase involved in cell wall biosynthesis
MALQPLSFSYPSSAHLVSVVVPTFNRPRLLRRALESIFAQDYPLYEVLVVNDSGEEPTDLFSGFEDHLRSGRLRFFSHSQRRGLAATRNTALRECRGEFIAYLDDDDRFGPGHLSRLAAALEEGDADIVYSDCSEVSYSWAGEALCEISRTDKILPEFEQQKLLRGNFISVLCLMHRRSCLEHAGGFDEMLTALEDWDLWVRFSTRYRFRHVVGVSCEVGRIERVERISAEHVYGYGWASLNCLFNFQQLFPAVTEYTSLADEALAALREQILEEWRRNSPDLSAIFSLHSPARVIERLEEFRRNSSFNRSRLAELQALLELQRGERAAAVRLLENALAEEPENAVARHILGLLQAG